MRITVILTCFNRREKTRRCLQSLVQGNHTLEFLFVVVDDASSDGTRETLKVLQDKNYCIHIMDGNGGLYWAGGMRIGIEYAKRYTESEFYMLINDDVEFFEHSVEMMLQQIKSNMVLVGSTCDAEGALSYGGIRYTGKGVQYLTIGPEDADRKCDTFNANCVLIPDNIFKSSPNIDPAYVHSLGDFDYGLNLKRRGRFLEVADFFVGICPENRIIQTWQDTTLGIKERIKMKESMKGAPWKPWFYFLKKNFGIRKAVRYSFTPFIRIFLGR